MDLTISILLIIIAGVIGFIIGKVMSNRTGDNVTEKAKNEQLQAQLDQYKQDVEAHFSTSAELLGSMAKEYSNVYKHMSEAQQSLLPDSDVIIKVPFKEPKENSLVKEAITEVELEAQIIANDEQKVESSQPNDYVQGSNNIITPKINNNEKTSA